MLVLSRKPEEGVTLQMKCKDGTEKEVKIKVVEVRGNKVRLGFDADEEVFIFRDELLVKKKEELTAAGLNESIERNGVARKGESGVSNSQQPETAAGSIDRSPV